MIGHRMCRWWSWVAVLLLAGCDSPSQETQAPPLPDVRYDRLQGRVEQITATIYLLERPADVAAVLDAPETYAPPVDLPLKSKDGEEVNQKVTAMRYGPTGNTLTNRIAFPTLGGSEYTITVTPKSAGLRSVSCEGVLAYKDRPKHPFSCGRGEWSYRAPGVWRLMVDGDAGTMVIERQVDAQGRETAYDQKSNGKPGPSGEKAKHLSQHTVSLAYDHDGRTTVASDIKNGQTSYRYTTYSQFDHHGNPQRAVVLSSTSADPHERAAVTRIELRLYAYTYYDEIR